MRVLKGFGKGLMRVCWGFGGVFDEGFVEFQDLMSGGEARENLFHIDNFEILKIF